MTAIETLNDYLEEIKNEEKLNWSKIEHHFLEKSYLSRNDDFLGIGYTPYANCTCSLCLKSPIAKSISTKFRNRIISLFADHIKESGFFYINKKKIKASSKFSKKNLIKHHFSSYEINDISNGEFTIEFQLSDKEKFFNSISDVPNCIKAYFRHEFDIVDLIYHDEKMVSINLNEIYFLNPEWFYSTDIINISRIDESIH